MNCNTFTGSRDLGVNFFMGTFCLPQPTIITVDTDIVLLLINSVLSENSTEKKKKAIINLVETLPRSDLSVTRFMNNLIF